MTLLLRNVQRFRGGLVFKAHRPLYHSTLDLSVIKMKKKTPQISKERDGGCVGGQVVESPSQNPNPKSPKPENRGRTTPESWKGFAKSQSPLRLVVSKVILRVETDYAFQDSGVGPDGSEVGS